MSPESNKPISVVDEVQPKEGLATAPILLVGLFALLVFLGLAYLENYGGGFSDKVYFSYKTYAEVDVDQPTNVVDPRVLGGRIFAANCTPCHQASGLGLPGQFPPVAGSEWVNAKSPNRIIRVVLNGIQGPIKVKDQPFNNVMVPWKATLNDEQIAAVLTFIRGNKDWGNDAPVVTVDAVKAIHDKIKDRDAAFTADELLKLKEDE